MKEKKNFFCKLGSVLLTLPSLQKKLFLIEFSLKINVQVSVLERQCQGLFKSVIEYTSLCVSNILICNQRHPKLKKIII